MKISNDQNDHLINLLAANNILKEGRRSLGDITDAEAEVTKPVKRLELICH